jgi:hypothetical protein
MGVRMLVRPGVCVAPGSVLSTPVMEMSLRMGLPKADIPAPCRRGFSNPMATGCTTCPVMWKWCEDWFSPGYHQETLARCNLCNADRVARCAAAPACAMIPIATVTASRRAVPIRRRARRRIAVFASRPTSRRIVARRSEAFAGRRAACKRLLLRGQAACRLKPRSTFRSFRCKWCRFCKLTSRTRCASPGYS